MKDTEKKVAEALAGLNNSDIQKEKLLGFLNTQEGKNLASKLGSNSAAVSGILKNMSAEDISKTLRNIDLSKFKGIDINELLKKLR